MKIVKNKMLDDCRPAEELNDEELRQRIAYQKGQIISLQFIIEKLTERLNDTR